MTYSRLHEAMSGKRGISPKVAGDIASKMGLAKREREVFVTNVEALHARSAITRGEAVSKLKAIAENGARQALELDVFETISNWYHYAILELTRVEGFQPESGWIAARLGIQPTEAQSALERLLRMKLLKKTDGKLSASNEFVFTPSGTASAGLKRHHEQLIERAKSALYFQTLQQRDITSVIMAIDSAEMDQAKSSLKDFRRKFSRTMEASQIKDSVYCLSLQFFQLDQTTKERK